MELLKVVGFNLEGGLDSKGECNWNFLTKAEYDKARFFFFFYLNIF